MNDDKLEKLIRLERDKRVPDCPRMLEANVLRRIRLSRNEADERFGFDWLLGAFQQTRFAAAALFMVLLVSTTASMVATSEHASSLERRRVASNALDFDVFREAPILKLDN